MDRLTLGNLVSWVLGNFMKSTGASKDAVSENILITYLKPFLFWKFHNLLHDVFNIFAASVSNSTRIIFAMVTSH